MKRIVARSFAHVLVLVVAGGVFTTAHAGGSASDTCAKLVHHESVFVVAIHVAGAVYWNGADVSPAQFDEYLQTEQRTHPEAIFHVTWNGAAHAHATKLIQDIRAHGFEMAFNCPPIPF